MIKIVDEAGTGGTIYVEHAHDIPEALVAWYGTDEPEVTEVVQQLAHLMWQTPQHRQGLGDLTSYLNITVIEDSDENAVADGLNRRDIDLAAFSVRPDGFYRITLPGGGWIVLGTDDYETDTAAWWDFTEYDSDENGDENPVGVTVGGTLPDVLDAIAAVWRARSADTSHANTPEENPHDE